MHSERLAELVANSKISIWPYLSISPINGKTKTEVRGDEQCGSNIHSVKNRFRLNFESFAGLEMVTFLFQCDLPSSGSKNCTYCVCLREKKKSTFSFQISDLIDYRFWHICHSNNDETGCSEIRSYFPRNSDSCYLKRNKN